jgi:hypothetical protein
MIKSIRISVTSALLVMSYGSIALESSLGVKDLPKLTQESQHVASAKRVTSQFLRAHYKPIDLDDELSVKIFDRFIRSIDFNHNVFTAEDIQVFSVYKNKFDDSIERGNLSIAYEIYQLNMQRRTERYEYALTLLDKEFNYELANDTFIYDREDAAWAKNSKELDELWRQRVKYDALNLKLAGKDWPKIQELLTKRYERAIKRLTQTSSEDVFQTVMNSFARSIEAHTSYLSPRNAERFQMEMNLSFEGIGAVLLSEDDFTTIRSVVPAPIYEAPFITHLASLITCNTEETIMLMTRAATSLAPHCTRTACKTAPMAIKTSKYAAGMQRPRSSRGITTKNYPAIPKDDFGEYSEYSVIFTNRSLNLMSSPFQRIMKDLNGLLKDTYNADKVAIMPG